MGCRMQLFMEPQIVKIISKLKNNLRINSKSLDDIPKFVFVCGEKILDDSGNILPERDLQASNNIRHYIISELEEINKSGLYGKKYKQVKCIISEKIYTSDLADDILTFEEILAEISENIIIIAESAGTFCELGAFSLDKFCKKTIVINEDNPNYKSSFITLGPIKKIESQNENNVILYSDKSKIRNSFKLASVINDLKRKEINIELNDNTHDLTLKYLIYEFLNIIELFQPIDDAEIGYVYKNLRDINNYNIFNSNQHKISSFRKVLLLMEKMDLIKKRNGYYEIDNNISTYNVMFTLNRTEFMQLRMEYLSKASKEDRKVES